MSEHECTNFVSIQGKTSDMCFTVFEGCERDYYVPDIPGLGGGDYLELDICIDCGKLQGWNEADARQVLGEFLR